MSSNMTLPNNGRKDKQSGEEDEAGETKGWGQKFSRISSLKILDLSIDLLNSF